MSERPTPETDAETMRDEYDHVDSDLGPFAPSNTVCADFARKLERERDEALMDRARGETATMTINHYERILRERDEWAAMCGRYKQERDEARELVYAWESRWKAEVEFAAKVSVKRDELQDILRKLLGIIPEPECHDFGHTKEERHTFFEKCPVMERYDALIAQAKEAAK